jgi:hypothetical protein
VQVVDDRHGGEEQREGRDRVRQRGAGGDVVLDAVDEHRARRADGSEEADPEASHPHHERDAGHVDEREGEVPARREVDDESQPDHDQAQRDCHGFVPDSRHPCRCHVASVFVGAS